MKIVIGGDVVPKPVSEKYFVSGDAETLFTDVLPILRGADAAIVNLECALTLSDNAIRKFGPNLKADPQCVNGLKNAGITDIALSNNHVFDFGIDGLCDTADALKKAGLRFTGVGNNDKDSRKIRYIEQGGVKVGVVNVCEHEYSYALPNRMGANPFDPFVTMQDIREAKKNSDFVIVLYHGAKEHCRYPSPRMYELCREMANNGAGAIITQHSHCIGCYENYNGAHILHGQGNFHFLYEDNSDDMWNTCMLVRLDIKKDGTSDIKFYPVKADPPAPGISLAKGKDGERLMNEFASRNEELKNGKWLDGWHEFCVGKSALYKQIASLYKEDATEKDKHLFAHYLDCEAHTDVWRELFKTWNHTNELGSNKKI